MAEIYLPKGLDELKARVLRDLELAAIDAGIATPATQPGSDYDLISTMLAGTALIGFANQAELDRTTSVFDAEGDDLDAIREGDGLPELKATPSSGRLKVRVLGAVTIQPGQRFQLPNGLRGQVIGRYVNPSDGDEIEVETIDAGKATRLAGGQRVVFNAPPLNLGSEAKVSYQHPLVGGTDEESDPEKRARILTERRNKPGGGNWAQLRKLVKESGGTVVEGYVYPGLGGPSSAKVVVAKTFDPDLADYSRAPTQSMLNRAASFIHANNSGGEEVIIQGAADEVVDFGVLVELPSSAQSGGSGQGWTDATPWPALETADSGRVTIDAVNTSYDVVTVSAVTATSPVAGQTHISWWSGIDRRFYHALVISVSGGTGAWVLTLDVPFVDSLGNGPVLGDFISPQAQNIDKYGKTWISLFNELGTGENTDDSDRLPRALRHPFATDTAPAAITRATLKRLSREHEEITDIDFGWAPQKTPSLPANVSTAPNVLVPRRLGFYSI